MVKPKFEVKKELSEETLKYLKTNNLMTVRQYAEKIGKSEWVVQRMCKQNKPPHKLTRKKWGNMWVIKNK